MKTRPELKEMAVQHMAERAKSLPPDKAVGTIRVDLSHVEQLTFEAIPKGGKEFKLTIDEPQERGGMEKGPPPLHYFLAGAGACLLTQYAKLAMMQELPVDSLEMVVRGHIDRGLDGAFRDVVFEVHIVSAASEDQVRKLAQDSERYCYVHNTLKKAIPVTTQVRLNGKPLLTLTSSP